MNWFSFAQVCHKLDVQPQEKTRSLKFWTEQVEELYCTVDWRIDLLSR